MHSRVVMFLLALPFAVCCVQSIAAAPELLRDRSADLRPTLLVLGTAHFANPGRDLLNPAIDDVLSPVRQAQIISVVKQIAKFRPTRVVLEWPAAQQGQLDSM